MVKAVINILVRYGLQIILCGIVISGMLLPSTYVLLASGPNPQSNGPTIPHYFWGHVSTNGGQLAAKVEVTAWINGEQRGSITTDEAGQYGDPDLGNYLSVTGADVLSLSWETNSERDLKGYRVWRKAEDESNFVVLTPDPILENSFTDASVEKNKRYYYAITALDKNRNESEKSDAVSEIIKESM